PWQTRPWWTRRWTAERTDLRASQPGAAPLPGESWRRRDAASRDATMRDSGVLFGNVSSRPAQTRVGSRRGGQIDPDGGPSSDRTGQGPEPPATIERSARHHVGVHRDAKRRPRGAGLRGQTPACGLGREEVLEG